MFQVLTWQPPIMEGMISNAKSINASHCATGQVNTTLELPPHSLKRKRSFDESLTLPINVDAIKAPCFSGTCEPIAPDDVDLLSSNVSPPLTEPASPVKVPKQIEELNVSRPRKRLMTGEARYAAMRQTVSNQLNLEILLKHRELRLIDQELAKCQVALEQLRRCAERPFPGSQSFSENVTMGTGAAIRKPGRHQARSPAPWGVVDGPYTRHYAKWLLPDPHFDGGRSEPLSAQVANGARSSRGNVPDFAQLAGKTSRAQRAAQHAALPAGFSEPRQKPTGPMILKRKSDGKMVKLVCPDCGRLDFGSAQGFINHCRIGHQRNFASHDAAAEGCGEALAEGEEALVQEVALKPMIPPVLTIPQAPINASVNPLVRSAYLTPQSTLENTPVDGYLPKAKQKRGRKPKAVKAKSGPQAHLGDLIARQCLNVNLPSLVSDMKAKVDTDDDMFEVSYEPDTPISVTATPITSAPTRHLHTAGKKGSSKSTGASMRTVGNASYPPPSMMFSFSSHEPSHVVDTPMSSLVPSPTNDSYQAPSLIDDDEDMDPQSPASFHEPDHMDMHFHVRDDEQSHFDDGHEMRGTLLNTPISTCAPAIRSVFGTVPAPQTPQQQP